MAEERRVVIAMDGSKHADFAFQYYKDHCHRENDQLIIVYCAEYNSIRNQSITLMTIDPALISNLISEEDKEMKKISEKFEALVKENKMKGKIVRLHGEPGPGIVKFAEEQDAALIIVGSRGLGTVRRTLIGSVSDYVVHHAHVPVLVCRH